MIIVATLVYSSVGLGAEVSVLMFVAGFLADLAIASEIGGITVAEANA